MFTWAMGKRVKGTVTAAMRRRVMELHGEGLSLRQIAQTMTAEGDALSHVSVATLVRGQGEQGERKARARARESERAGVGGRGGTGESAGGAQGGADDVLAEMGGPPEGASLMARMLWEELVSARAAARELRRKMIAEGEPAGPWAAAIGQVRQLLKALADEMPAPPPDPERDPTNIAARQAVHARVLQAIETAEARHGRHCGRCRAELE